MYNLIDQTGKLKFGPGEDYSGPQLKLFSSSSEIMNRYDVLIFTDSKGSATDIPGKDCWTELLVKKLERSKKTFLFVSRPKKMTVFFSLINFITINEIKFDYLITNVGFVDFTPKKESFIDDIYKQVPVKIIKKNKKYIPLCKYRLSNSKLETLYNYSYGNIHNKIARFLSLNFKYSLLIGCLEFSEKIKIERSRPDEFFKQLKKTNEFLFRISQRSERTHYLQPLKYQFENLALLSYDAVHYTNSGHLLTFSIIQAFIDSYIINVNI